MAMTGKQRLFVEYYLGEAHGNATEAARLAGYAPSTRITEDILKNPTVAALIAERIAPLSVKADAILALLCEHATASLADFLSFDDKGVARVDLARAERLGKLHLVKKLTLRPDGTANLELVDSQSALALLGKYHRLFTERIELEEKGPVEIRYVNDWR